MLLERIHYIVLYIVGLFALVPSMAAANVTEITIITAKAPVNLKVEWWTAPEKWDDLTLTKDEELGNSGRLIVMPGERYFWFHGVSGRARDVLYVDANRQVVGILENVNDNGLHGVCEPSLAVVLLPAGFVEQHGIGKGNLIVSEKEPLRLHTMTSDRQLRTELSVMLKRLSRSASTNSRSTQELGECYLSHRMYTDAVMLFERAIRKGSDVKVSRIGLAVALAGTGKYETAMNALISVIEEDSTNVDAYLHLARLFQKVKKIDAVVATLANGVKQHPELLTLRLELAKLCVRIGMLDDAASVLHDAPLSSSKDPAADAAAISRVTGDIHLRRGEMTMAAKAYQHFLKVYPNAPHGAELRLFISRHAGGERAIETSRTENGGN